MRKVVGIEMNGDFIEISPTFKNVATIESRLGNGIFSIIEKHVDRGGMDLSLNEIKAILSSCIDNFSEKFTDEYIFNNRLFLSKKIIEFFIECVKTPETEMLSSEFKSSDSDIKKKITE